MFLPIIYRRNTFFLLYLARKMIKSFMIWLPLCRGIAEIILYRIKYKKIIKKVKKTLAFFRMVVYTLNCCDIDSNEARGCCHRDGRFSVERMSSLKTDDKSLYKFRRPSRDGVCGKNLKDTHGDVYSRRLSYCLKSTNRRRLFLWQIR